MSILITDYLGGKVACFSTPSSVAFITDYIRIQNSKIVKDIHKTVQNQLYTLILFLAILGQKKINL